jgi:hypothetical protein
MYYLYDNNRLIPLRHNGDDSIALARFTDCILVSNKIDEVIQISHYPKAAFLLHSNNIATLFTCWKYQLRYRTLNEFRIIIYAAPKKMLYRLLSFVSLVSFGTYRLITFPRRKR